MTFKHYWRSLAISVFVLLGAIAADTYFASIRHGLDWWQSYCSVLSILTTIFAVLVIIFSNLFYWENH